MDLERVDRFVVMGPFGEGAGRTWLASDESVPGRRVVLKVAQGPEGQALVQEARWMRTLAHPGLASLVDAGRESDRVWLAIAYVEGRDLRAVAKAGGVPASVGRHVLASLAETLGYVHRFGVVHGDVSPANVRLDPAGNPILLDLGSVTPFGERVQRSTPGFHPAEDVASAAYDTYALGRVLQHVVPPGSDPEFDGWVAAMTQADPALRPELAGFVRLTGGRAPAMSATLDGSGQAHGRAHGQDLGRYQVQREIGRGGMGVVYAAYDPILRRDVAVKVGLFGDPRRFLREAYAAGRLDHPNIVRVFDAGESPEGAFLAMERVDGPTLAAYLGEHGPWKPSLAADLARSLASALAHAHAQGVVHRDVKPSNVLLERGTVPKLADFGLASVASQESAVLTRTGALVGTPRYTAPEVLRGQPPGPAVDIWGLGLVLYETLTGRAAFDGPHPDAIHAQVLGDEPVSPRQVDPTLPLALDRIVRKATARRPEDRYPSMQALIADLDRQRAGTGVAVPLRVSRREWASWLRRRATGVVAGALAVVAGVALTVAGTALYLRQSEEEARQERAAAAWEALAPRLAIARLEGRMAEADATLEAFVSLPDVQQTAALTRVWLDEAIRRTDVGDRVGAREAWSRAWFEAQRPAERAEALRGLVAFAREDGRWTDLVAMVGIGRAYQVDDTDGFLSRAEREASWLRGFPPPAPVRTDRAEPVVQALLGGAYRTAWSADKLLPMRIKGRQAWALSRDDVLSQVVGDGSRDLPVLFQPASMRAPAVPIGRAEGARLILAYEGWNRLVSLRDGRWTDDHRWEGSRAAAAVEGDLDRDGRAETLVGVGPYDRRLWAFHPDPGGVVAVDPHPPTSATASDVVAIDRADLDGDGSEEVVVVMGPWGAFDIRILRGGGGRELTFVTRQKIGSLRGLALLPDPRGGTRILVNVTEQWPSYQQFPREAPAGERRGSRLLAFRDGKLQVEATLRFPAMCKGWVVGDFDGDEVVDAVTDCSGDMGVIRQDRAGQITTAIVPRVVPRASGQLDGDRADELLVNLHRDPTQAVWALGVGDERVDTGVLPPESAPAPVGGEVGLRWQRAEDLLAMGQIDEAILTFRAVADLARAPSAAGAALRRAARALEARGQCERAEPLWEAAAKRDPALAASDLNQGVRCALQQYRWADALAGTERLLSDPDIAPERREEARRVRAELQARGIESPWIADFSAGLPEGVLVSDPLAVREGRGGLAFSADRAEILRVPLQWDGRAVGLEVEMDLTRLEWAAGFYVTLQPLERTGERYGIGVKALGGGGVVRAHLRAPWGPTDRHDVSVPRTAADEKRAVTLLYAADGEAGRWRARARGLGERELVLPSGSEIERPVPGRYDLVVEARPEVAGHAVVAGLIRRIRVDGAQPVPVVPTPTQLQARALATWRPAGAASSAEPLFRFVAADDAGDPDAAARALAGMARDEASLRRLARARPASVLPLLRTLLPQRWLAVVGSAWEGALGQHPDDPEVESFLLERTAPVERAGPAERGGESGEAWYRLLLARARVAVRTGRLDRADDLLTLAQNQGTPPDLWLEWARLASARGQADLAVNALLRALEGTPSSTVFADRIAADPDLRPLYDHPGWARIRAAQGGDQR
jgi:serine/threonine protein kinase